jgi:hypothetical protein
MDHPRRNQAFPQPDRPIKTVIDGSRIAGMLRQGVEHGLSQQTNTLLAELARSALSISLDILCRHRCDSSPSNGGRPGRLTGIRTLEKESTCLLSA